MQSSWRKLKQRGARLCASDIRGSPDRGPALDPQWQTCMIEGPEAIRLPLPLQISNLSPLHTSPFQPSNYRHQHPLSPGEAIRLGRMQWRPVSRADTRRLWVWVCQLPSNFSLEAVLIRLVLFWGCVELTWHTGRRRYVFYQGKSGSTNKPCCSSFKHISTITVGSVLAAGCYQSCSASGSSHRCGYWLILTSPVPYIRFGLGWRDASGLSVGHALAPSPTSMWPKPVIQLCSPVLYWLPAKVLPCVLCCVISMLFAFRSTAERDGCSKAKGC